MDGCEGVGCGVLWGKSIHSDRHGGAAIGLSHLSTSHYPLLGNVKELILDFLEIHDGLCKLTGNIENALLKLQLMIQIRTNWTDQNQSVLCFQYIWWMFPNLHILPEAGVQQLSFIALQHLHRPDWNTTRVVQEGVASKHNYKEMRYHRVVLIHGKGSCLWIM